MFLKRIYLFRHISATQMQFQIGLTQMALSIKLETLPKLQI